jgi:hypothetical protein
MEWEDGDVASCERCERTNEDAAITTYYVWIEKC